MILNSWVESLTKLQHNVRAFEVPRSIDELAKIVDVFVDGASALVILRRLELRSRRLNLVLRTEVGDKFYHEVGPRLVGQTSHRVVPAHLSIDEPRRSSALHEGHD